MSLAKLEREVLGDRLDENDQVWFPRWVRRYAMGVRNGMVDDLPVNKSSVVNFSRALLANGAPAWQRWQAVRAVVFHRDFVLQRTEPDRTDMVLTLAKLGRQEQNIALEAPPTAESTQNQAQSGLLFFYECVLGKQLGFLNAVRAKRSESIAVWFSREEVERLLVHFVGVHRLMFLLIYGAGLRHKECRRLRIKDICFDEGHIPITAAKSRQAKWENMASPHRRTAVCGRIQGRPAAGQNSQKWGAS